MPTLRAIVEEWNADWKENAQTGRWETIDIIERTWSGELTNLVKYVKRVTANNGLTKVGARVRITIQRVVPNVAAPGFLLYNREWIIPAAYKG